jgi:hypothetical protein
MEFIKHFRKPISICVTFTFIILVCIWTSLGTAAESDFGTTLKPSDDSCPNFFEQDQNEKAMVKKGKRFPWLFASFGVVAIGIVIYSLSIKPGDSFKNSIMKGQKSFINGVLKVNGVHYEMASIPSGEFQMGSDSPQATPFEKPVHTVRISKGYWMGKTEVTQELWKAVMGTISTYHKLGADYPVEAVSWDDCDQFIKKLNELFGGNAFRFPTEAEWEYACRAGTTGDLYGEIDAIAWWGYNSDSHTHPVGQKQPNAWGLYDTIGNVWEWCLDYGEIYSAGYQIDPCGRIEYYSHAIRGCGIHCGGTPSAAGRLNWISINKTAGLGFRLARTAE